MLVLNLLEESLIQDWLLQVNPKPNTRRNYLQGFQFYTEYLKKTPAELLDEAEAEISNGVLPRQRSIKRYLAGYRQFLQNKGLAATTIKGYVTGVKSFYSSFEIEIPKLKLDKAIPMKKHKQIPTKEELREVLGFCDPLEKAIMLVGVSSGLSANEIINLKVSDYENGYDQEIGITTLDLRRGKVEFDFITFLTPEASEAVKTYLDYRGREMKSRGIRRNDQLQKQRVFLRMIASS
jgi:integrase